MSSFSEILEVTRLTDRYNLHSHTEFCDGRAQMRAFAAKAVESGLVMYGFTPHSPVNIESTCNMHRDKVSEYLAEVARLREIYGDRIKLLAGMEIDYLGAEWGPSSEYFMEMPLDYRIGSLHFIPDREGCQVDVDGSHEGFAVKLENRFNGDLRYVVETFFSRSIEMVRAGGFDIVGHYDKIVENASSVDPGIEEEPWFQSLVSDLTDEIIAKGVAVEINTKMLEQRGRVFPSPRYWGRLIEAGVPIVVDSDAHVPALIESGRGRALEMLHGYVLQSQQ